MLLNLHVLATIRAGKFFKRETKAGLSPMVQGTMKCFCPTPQGRGQLLCLKDMAGRSGVN